jgi:PAS domain S-box-containing protein
LSCLDGNAALLDDRGNIVAVNEAWTRFGMENGGPPSSVGVGTSYIEVCRRSRDAHAVLQGLLSVLNGRTSIFRWEYRCDSPETLRWFQLTITPWPSRKGGALVLHRNISEYKLPLEIQNRTLAHVRAIVWAADAPSFRTSFLSGQVEQILGFPVQAWLDDPELWKKQLHPEDRRWVLEYSRKAVREGRNHEFDYRMLTADGRVVWLHQNVSLVREHGQPLHLIGISFDVSALKCAQEELRILGGRLLSAEDQERARIARELHDDIGQRLSMVSIDLGLVQSTAAASMEEFRCTMSEAKKQISEIVQDISAMSHGLHSYVLDSRGLAAASADFCKNLEARRKVVINFRSRNVPQELPREMSLSLFRVLQEALQNGLKYSGVKAFEVTLFGSSRNVELTVRDEGRGFDVKEVMKRSGLGLTSMQERMKLIGGDFSIDSRVPGGTTIRAQLPIKSR